MDWAKIAVRYVNGSTDAFTTYHTAPSEKPDEFATLRLSSVRSNGMVMCNPTYIVKCWAKTREAASVMADEVRRVMLSAPDELANVFGANQIGDYDEPDPPLGYRQRVLTFEFIANE